MAGYTSSAAAEGFIAGISALTLELYDW